MPRPERVVADTHALLWWQAVSDRLSASARAILDRADRVLVSPISCWEIAMLVERGRIALDRPVAAWVTDLFGDGQVGLAPLTPGIAVAAGELKHFNGDPADRLIFATAVAHAVPLITKDHELRQSAERDGRVTTVW
jgi:PIN domain nuclease of toxin-antitoxin system